ncbi:hypothetical protein HNQ77_001528 [Silvibacterium bohemicum]|uniref:Uncharacterized protein n=1 Tax=Silvibacterium bohemicum TaxID=1577686 RepID=A0A841JV07_9BACT|nr:hypothetical protein [Silvibacterium bohemicum]MBB6143579.1 hypothetical protein [Silvibacterium bohemicum]
MEDHLVVEAIEEQSRQTGETYVPTTIEVSVQRFCQIGCDYFISQPVTFDMRAGSSFCTPIPMPLYRIEQSATLRVRAYDCSFTDFVENAKSFLNGVGVTVTAVTVQSPGNRESLFTPPQIFTTKTINGVAEINDLPPNRLYAVEFIDPPGYMSDSPGPRHRYIAGDATIEMAALFCPCNQTPERTLVFVRQDCPNVRCGSLSFEVNGKPQLSTFDGIWSGLRGLTGTVGLSAPGKTLSPNFIDLSSDHSAVLQISVAEKTQKQLTAPVKGQFLSDTGVPFANRKLTVQLPGTAAYTIWTDSQGYFDAPSGATVAASDDAFGYPTAFLVS